MGNHAASTDVVVVGGGITGSLTAYFLASRGIRTTIVERSKIGSGTSGQNPGGLNPLHGPGIPGPMAALALESFRLNLEIWDALGIRRDRHRRAGG